MPLLKNARRAEQLILFDGLQWGTITPTDIDGMIDYKNKVFIFFELKLVSYTMPNGQRLALERLADNLQLAGRSAHVLVAEHNTPLNQSVDAKSAWVNLWYHKKSWVTIKHQPTLKKAIDGIIQKFGQS